MKRIILLLNLKSFYHALNETSLCHEFKMLILKMCTHYKCGGLFILTYTFLPIFTLLLLCGVCVSGKKQDDGRGDASTEKDRKSSSS